MIQYNTSYVVFRLSEFTRSNMAQTNVTAFLVSTLIFPYIIVYDECILRSMYYYSKTPPRRCSSLLVKNINKGWLKVR